jgi:predicted nucleic acid binding AN1-type Zn finger protein
VISNIVKMGMDDADMMNVGIHCQFHPECNQLDFLPFKCSGCQKIYCQEHRSAAAHKCPNGEFDIQVIICPVCAMAVRLLPTEDPNVSFERHQRTGCNPENYDKVHKKKKCSVKLCKEKLVSTNSITCKDCGAVTCLRHRLAEDHKCPGPPAAPPSGIRAAFGNLFTGFNSTTSSLNGTTTTTATTRTAAPLPATASRMTSAKSKVSFVAKKASTSLQTQLQDYKSSQKNKNNPTSNMATSTTTTATTPAAEQCPQCGERFSTVQALIDHASSAHLNGWSSGNTLPVRPSSTSTGGNERCPHCAATFDDPVALVHHVESRHRGSASEVCVLL